MAKEISDTILSQGFAGRFFDINQGPLVLDIIDILLKDNSGLSSLQDNCPVYISSTGLLSSDRSLSLTLAEESGRIIYFRVNNSDINSNNIILIPTADINGSANLTLSDNGDYLLLHQDLGFWRCQRLWSFDDRSNLELELEFKSAELFYFKELSYTGINLTSVDIYTNNTKTIKLFNKTLSYASGKLSQTVLTRISDGVVVTKNFAYTGNNLESITST